MKSVVLAEKPSVARDIARVLKCNKKIEGALEGEKYIVTWALGHLVTLADPESYDNKYKEWKMEHLPMLPEKFQLEVIKQSGKQYHAVKKQLCRKDVGEVVIATDAGREGELVARFILEKANCRKPLKRLWISSVTDKAIREGFSYLKNGKEYDNLYRAAISRAEADWIVGMNATRALTCKYNAQLSCGRVQTPTLAMIARREEERKNFKPETYYGIQVKTMLGAEKKSPVTFTWQDGKSKSYRTFQKEKIESIQKKIEGKKGKIVKVHTVPKKAYAPLLYDLTELQRDANKRFGFSAKETLNIMQRLYENHKVLTYPRTDSRYLTSDIVGTLKERLRACAVGPYKKVAGKLSMQNIKAKPSFVDDKKVSDHHAIIPTEQVVILEHMTIEERKIYDLVVKRFLAVLSEPFVYEQTTVELSVEGETFLAKGKVVKELGWKAVYENSVMEEEEETDLAGQSLPKVKEGELVEMKSTSITKGQTTPPALFTEATLLSAMENPVQYLENKDKSMVKVLGETGGLGTVATRADIIDKLFRTFLLEKKGKDIVITSKGKQLLELVPEDLKKPELTAQIEMKLSKIGNGSMKREAFMKEMEQYTKELVSEIKTGEGTFRHDNLTNTKCPNCGKRMLSVNGKNSKLLVCQDRECGYRETVARTTNARCPKCHKKMELYGKGEKQVFRCACGYKEKLEAFQTRRKKEGAGVSKKDVAKYLKEQKKQEESFNNPFAAAFAKLENEEEKKK